MNYIFNIGHTQVIFHEELEGDYSVTCFMFAPKHNNWVPFSNSRVPVNEAFEMMARLTRKELML